MDLSEILSSLSEDDIKQLQNTASAIFGSSENSSAAEQKKESPMLSDIGRLTAALSGNDERTAFVEAMKPLLSEDRRQKADEVIRILRLISIIPILRESGLMNGIL